MRFEFNVSHDRLNDWQEITKSRDFIVQLCMSETTKNDNSTAGASKTLKESLLKVESTLLGKELRVSSILQGLLDKHKAQSLIIESLKDELNYLKKTPLLYFQNRKRFLYHAYTKTSAECQAQMNFDVKVRQNVYLTNRKLDACYAFTDRGKGLVFGHIYQSTPMKL